MIEQLPHEDDPDSSRLNPKEDGKPDVEHREPLPPFTFRQMGVCSIELQALPDPEARPLCAKTIRQGSFLGPGGQAVLSPKTGLIPCRGARPGARLPASFCGKAIGPPAGILFPPMLFAHNGLASGPQTPFSAEEKGTKVKGSKIGNHLDRLDDFSYFGHVGQCAKRSGGIKI